MYNEYIEQQWLYWNYIRMTENNSADNMLKLAGFFLGKRDFISAETYLNFAFGSLKMPEAAIALGDLHSKNGNREDALRWYRAALNSERIHTVPDGETTCLDRIKELEAQTK